MKVWKFYALWVTRNGQHLWSGPYASEDAAQNALDHTMYCTGKRILRDSVEEGGTDV